MDKLALIKRNTEEVVEEKELKELIKKKKNPVVYHGFEPSGKGVHIGYMIGINKLIDFQKAGFKVVVLFADLHAWLNEKGSLNDIKKIADVYKKSFKALGLDIKKTKFVMGSSFQLKKDYFKDILKLSLMIRMQRGRRAMTVIGREEENPHISQVIYPLMQVADMKHLKIDIAFGDLAQRKIHMLARENLPSINYKSPVCIHHIDMVGLKGGKMSSSVLDSLIMINDKPDEIKRKIKKSFCPDKQVKDNPILQICKYIIFNKLESLRIKRDKKFGGDLIFESYEDLEKEYLSGKLHPADLKESVSENLIKILEPVRNVLK